MLKALMLALWQRVFVSYKSTFLGIALACLAEVASFLQALPENWAHIVAGILFFFLAMWKDKAPAPVEPVDPVDPPPAA